VLAIALGNGRPQLVFGEIPHGLPHEFLFVSQFEVHGGPS
jgi:hypothetical protein